MHVDSVESRQAQPQVSLPVEDADDKLSESVLTNPEHTLNLPDRRHELTYTLRRRQHDLTPSRESHRLSSCNFVVRQLFKDSY